jgi:hypothetical protein
MKILIVCEGELPQAASSIKERFAAEVLSQVNVGKADLPGYDYIVVVGSLKTIEVCRKATNFSTMTIALMGSRKELPSARVAGVAAAFTVADGSALANYITAQGDRQNRHNPPTTSPARPGVWG